MDEIKLLRVKIDSIDDQIMTLLNERYNITSKIGKLKEGLKIEILDTSREDLINNKTTLFSHYPQIKEVYKTIMYESRRQQRK